MDSSKLDNIKWHIKGTSTTLPKSKVIEYLQIPKGREALEGLGLEKTNTLLLQNIDDIADTFIIHFNNNAQLDVIFKDY